MAHTFQILINLKTRVFNYWLHKNVRKYRQCRKREIHFHPIKIGTPSVFAEHAESYWNAPGRTGTTTVTVETILVILPDNFAVSVFCQNSSKNSLSVRSGVSNGQTPFLPIRAEKLTESFPSNSWHGPNILFMRPFALWSRSGRLMSRTTIARDLNLDTRRLMHSSD